MKRPSAIFLLWSLVTATAFPQGRRNPAQELDEPMLSSAQSLATADSIRAYWTRERLRNARPMPIPMKVVDEAALDLSMAEIEEAEEDALPGFAPGWRPGQRPFVARKFTLTEDHPLYHVAAGTGAAPQHGAIPGNPRNGPYGPFQRYTEFDSIRIYPLSTHGKLFFTLNGLNFVCSATVIGRSTLITAGHCNSSGNGTFATNRLFCPAYRNGADPTWGCWTVANSKTSAGWHNNGDPDYDYACLITSPTGTRVANRIGNVTGWLGRAWNWSHTQAERTFGYPQAAPFNGNRLVTTTSTDWYSFHFRSGGQISKIIGSDLTGGSSGGSWVLGWNKPGHEFADTDANGATDPGANWVNGVNSHKRCRVNCSSPPTTTTGVYWQEMSSPPFRNTSAADETEDIISVCFANGGS